MLKATAIFLGKRVSDFQGSKGEPVSARYITLLMGTSPIEFGATAEAFTAAEKLAVNDSVSVEVSLYMGFSKAQNKEVLKARIEKLTPAK